MTLKRHPHSLSAPNSWVIAGSVFDSCHPSLQVHHNAPEDETEREGMTVIWRKEGCRELCMCSWRDEDRGGEGGERGEIPGLSVTPCGHLSALLFSSSFHPVPVTFTGRPQQRWWMESETAERTKIRVRETDEKWQTHGEENRKREREQERTG